MTSDLFDTTDKISSAVANFKMLKNDAGWQLVVQIVEGNIEVLEQQILDGFEEETKEAIDRKRDKLKAYKEVISTPDYWIEKLQTPILPQENPDPYHTVESYSREKKSN